MGDSIRVTLSKEQLLCRIAVHAGETWRGQEIHHDARRRDKSTMTLTELANQPCHLVVHRHDHHRLPFRPQLLETAFDRTNVDALIA